MLVVYAVSIDLALMNEECDGPKILRSDHLSHAFTLLLAGEGGRIDLTLRATDELGQRFIEDPISMHDLHASLLGLLGFDHAQLARRSQGRAFRLTVVEGEVVQKLLAWGFAQGREDMRWSSHGLENSSQ